MNGFCLCSGCHVRFTHDPIGWDNFLRAAWGVSVYAEMRRLALSGKPADMEAVKAKLAGEALVMLGAIGREEA
jgi:hypothetical protein